MIGLNRFKYFKIKIRYIMGVNKKMKFSEKIMAIENELKKQKGQQILKDHLILLIEGLLDVNKQTAENYLKELIIRGHVKEVSRQIYEYVGE